MIYAVAVGGVVGCGAVVWVELGAADGASVFITAIGVEEEGRVGLMVGSESPVVQPERAMMMAAQIGKSTMDRTLLKS
jgi:hypothetical protein